MSILAYVQSETVNSVSDFVVPIEEYSRQLEDPDNIHIFYCLNGGVNALRNQSVLPKSSAAFHPVQPYRYGYRFLGWYLEPSYITKVTDIDPSESGNLVLYARWKAKIDNYDNVEHYKYSTNGSKHSGSLLLKDCDYEFCEAIDIPGMPDTKESDFLNRYIYSEAQCPQGLCITDEFVLITSYSSEENCKGELMVIDRETGEYLVTLGMDENSHLGGIAFDGTNVWVCNSNKNTIERISYDFIELMAYQNTMGVVDATEVVDEYPVSNTPSCITYYNGRLWIATHTIFFQSKMVAYHLDAAKDELLVLGEYKIPSKVQGVAFDSMGRVYLSTSYGRKSSSFLKIYSSVVTMSSKPEKPLVQVEMPPCSEEIDESGGTVYVLFESAGEKYYEGTDGNGTSTSPLDKILMLNGDSILNP